MIHTHLSCNIIAVQKQHMGNASLINKMSEKSSSLIDSKHCINEEVFCAGWNYVGTDCIEP
jgi:hypothetical protein